MKFRIFSLFIFIYSLAFGQVDTVRPKVEKVEVIVHPSDYRSVDSLIKRHPTTDNVTFPRSFQSNFKSKYKGEEFDYTLVKPKESIMERMFRRLSQVLSTIFGKMEPIKAESIARTLLRLLVIAIVAFLLYFLVRFLASKDGNLFFSKKNKKLRIASQDLHENIHEIDFQKTIAEYEAKREWRFAIRYQFLLVLKKLSDQKIIDWNPEKTNKDYLKEISNKGEKEAFQKLIYIFDHVWYGEFDIDDARYEVFKSEFKNFKK